MGTGRVVAGRYRLEEELGEGGMGVVWRATDLELGRQVSLKRALGGDTGQIRREARIGAGLLHLNVVTVFDTVADGDDHWLVTEYLPARSLEQLLETDGPMPEDQVRRLGVQLASALEAMHGRGIVHRDIKPGNVLVTDDDDAKLTDLGIARWAEVTRTGGAQLTGTLGYLAPEVADGHEAGPPADIFSLGATLYAAVEGKSPWGDGEVGPFVQMRRAAAGRPDPTHRADRLAPVLAALMRRHPADRPTAAETRHLLDGGEKVPHRRPRLFHRRRRTLLAAGAVTGVIALVAAFALTRPSGGSDLEINTLGDDPAAVAPCAAISTNALMDFGQPFVDPELRGFGSCVVTTTLADKTGQVQTTLELAAPLRYPPRPPTPGKMGEIERPEARDGACERSVSLGDSNRIVIISRPVTRAEDAPLCSISESVLSDVLPMLANGPLPRRTQQFAPWSLARVDACGLLSGQDISRALGRATTADVEFGHWGCVWEAKPRTVTVRFTREWPIENDSEVAGERIRLGTRNAVVAPATTGNACGVQVVHKLYTPALAVLRGTEKNREEIAVVDFEDTSTTDTATLCATAKTLATAVTGRLP